MRPFVAAALFVTLFGAEALAFNVAISVKLEGGSKPTVVGTTNLPDGMELMVTLSRSASSYMARAKTKVASGEPSEPGRFRRREGR